MVKEGLKNDNAEDKPNHSKHEYLGQTYLYHKNIMAPEEVGMTPEGTMDALVKNVAGLVGYGQILITGDGHANAKVNREERDEPLGDKFFMKTMGTCYPIKVNDSGKPTLVEYDEKTKTEKTCDNRNLEEDKDKKTCDYIYYKKEEGKKEEGKKEELKEWDGEGARAVEDRYVYIDNLPTGSIPGLGTLKGMRGLIPGMIENLSAFNPMGLLNAITAPSVPPCVNLNMETIKFNDNGSNSADWKHTYGTDTHYVSLSDVAELKPCSFYTGNANDGKGTNPITGDDNPNCPKRASEPFKNLFENKNNGITLELKDKPIAKLFNTSFGLLMAYLLWKILKKEI